jgi:hypothetical protein
VNRFLLAAVIAITAIAALPAFMSALPGRVRSAGYRNVPAPLSRAATIRVLVNTNAPRPTAVLDNLAVERDRGGPFLIPYMPRTAAMTQVIGIMLPGHHLKASIVARVLEVHIRENSGCGSFARTYTGGFVRLRLVDSETGEAVAVRETHSTRWTRLSIDVVADESQMPYRLEFIAGVPATQEVTYRLFEGARCVLTTRTVASTGELRSPTFDVGSPWWPDTTDPGNPNPK